MSNQNNTSHLQTENPDQPFINWYDELCTLFAKAWGLDKIQALRRLNQDALREWYNDGFTAYVTFRENYQPII